MFFSRVAFHELQSTCGVQSAQAHPEITVNVEGVLRYLAQDTPCRDGEDLACEENQIDERFAARGRFGSPASTKGILICSRHHALIENSARARRPISSTALLPRGSRRPNRHITTAIYWTRTTSHLQDRLICIGFVFCFSTRVLWNMENAWNKSRLEHHDSFWECALESKKAQKRYIV